MLFKKKQKPVNEEKPLTNQNIALTPQQLKTLKVKRIIVLSALSVLAVVMVITTILVLVLVK
ncbi:MAG: hypothetical protein L3I91_00815 [Mycoplasma sp.]